MSTIDQKDRNDNPENEASGKEGRAERSTEETERMKEASEGSAARCERSDAMDHDGAVTDITAENTEEHATPSALRGLTSLAFLRAYIEEHGTSPEVERALSKLDEALRRPHAAQTEGLDDNAPASVTRRAGEDGGSNDDDASPTSRTLSPSMSRLAVRQDGALLVTLEDADDRDLAGREIIRCMVLSAGEAARALTTADSALYNAAASIIGRLPKRSR